MSAMLFPQYELRRAAWNLASDNVRDGEDVLIVTSSDPVSYTHLTLPTT